MGDLAINAIVNTVILLVGTVVGYWLNEWGSRSKATKAAKEQATAVQTLITLEIDENLADLDYLMHSVHDAVQNDTGDGREEPVRMASWLVTLPEPTWTHRMWDSQLSNIVASLTNEQVKRVYRFHQQIDTLASIRIKLSVLNDEQTASWDRAGAGGRGMAIIPMGVSLSDVFDRAAPPLWAEFRTLATQMHTEGNPLKAVRPTQVPW